MTEKMTVKEVGEGVIAEGLEYTITYGISPDRIADPKLADLWRKANAAIQAIEDCLTEHLGQDWEWQ